MPRIPFNIPCRRQATVALSILLLCGCAGSGPDGSSRKASPEPAHTKTAPLQSNPTIPGFAVYALHSARLADNAFVTGGDVGVELVGGPYLDSGYSLSLHNNAAVDASHDVLADSVLLDNNASVGDIETNHLVAHHATHGNVAALPAMPAPPSLLTASAGTTDVSVAKDHTAELAPGSYRNVVVENNAVLQLDAGSFSAASITIEKNAKVELLGSVQLLVAGSVAVEQNGFLGPAEGSGLGAGDLDLDVAGSDQGTTAVVTLQNNSVLVGLVLAPGGTLTAENNVKVFGAIVAGQIDLHNNASVTYQDGFPPPGCSTSCDDSNPCTLDACTNGACTHTAAADGTSCSDGNACTQTDACKNGVCVGSDLVTCTAKDQCHDAGSCDPATGQCSNPVKADGSACDDGDACTQTDTCQAGACSGSNPVTCTASDACHVTGTCDSATGTCSNPAAPAGTPCADGNLCNGAETCDGSGTCVAGTPLTVDDGNPCTADACDPVAGVSHTPVAAGTSCSDGNACNGAETCDGSGTCVAGVAPIVDDGNPCTTDSCDPATGVHHTPVAAGTSCSDGNACNGDETCDGSGTCVAGTAPTVDDGNPCTADACDPIAGVTHTAEPAGTSCADGNLCNGDETCDGSGVCVQGTAPTVDDGNPCTVDSCDPTTGVSHVPTAAGTACSDGNACNGDETCDGGGTCVAGVAPTVDDGNPCTADSCDPVLGVQHTPLPAGTSCADADLCNGNETCDGSGTCVAGTPSTIDDGNPCTADACDPITGVTHTPLPAGSSCSDGNACNGGETCDGSGTCQAGTAPTVDDGNPCTIDSCDAVLGVVHQPASAGVSCADGDACNGDEVCDGSGTCLAGTPPTVDDGNPCTVDTCDPTTGVSHVPTATGTSCSDGNACNGDETCDGSGTCTAGTAPTVDDGNPCTADSCDPASGVIHNPVPAGTSCSDGDLCNGAETCDGSGTCAAGTPPVVDDGNPCTADACDPSTGVSHTPVAAGTSCSDGNACNGDETCDGSGTCQAGTAPTLDDGNPCTADSCDPATGVSHRPEPAGTACADGNVCNGDETCDGSGTCQAGTPLTVDDGNPCTADACDPIAGVTHTPVSAGTSCSDGDACNGDETCDGSGTCQAGTAPTLDDGNPCTADACDPVLGVTHTPVAAGTSCSDGNACNGDETCDGSGTCLAGTAPAVDDGNPCTADSCDPLTGVSHTPVVAGTSCSDGDVCNGEETCDGSGTCVAGTPLLLDDGNPCTADSCDPTAGVSHTPVAAGTSCSDGNACNGDETCDGSGSCQSGTAPTVDDGNPCTTDSCDPATGVSHTPEPAGTACSDGNVCNGDETCDASGTCQAGTPLPLDDGNPCTTDACDPTSGVTHTQIPGCDSAPAVEGSRFETRASILGRVEKADGSAVTNYTVTVYDLDSSGATPRTDVQLTTAADGSFRARLATFPEQVAPHTPLAHLMVHVDSPDFPRLVRTMYLRPGDVWDMGIMTVLQRDSAVTYIGPAGGTATDSQNLVEVDIPPNALSSTIPVRITPVKTRPEFPYPLPDSTATTYGFVLEPSGTQFAVPVSVHLANYRNVPTSVPLPLGSLDEQKGEWRHEGWALWDGTAFTAQISHFSAWDGNPGGTGTPYYMISHGPDVDNSKDQMCPASSVSLGGGSVRESYEVARSTRSGMGYSVDLIYDSGLAGSRELGQSPDQSGVDAAVSTAGFRVPISGTELIYGCAPPGASPPAGACGTGGACSGGVAFPHRLGLQTQVAGTDVSVNADTPVGAQGFGTGAYVDVPLNPDGSVPPPSYWLTRTEFTLGAPSSGGGGACVGGGGSVFGGSGTNPTVQTSLDPGPVSSVATYQLAYHRRGSSVGAGWGVAGINELYQAPDGAQADLVTGSGLRETFIRRPVARSLTSSLPFGPKPMTHDATNGDVFLTDTSYDILQLNPDASTSPVFSSLPLASQPLDIAVGYVSGQRHFVLALATALVDVDPSGNVAELLPRTDSGGAGSYPHVAVRDALAFYTSGHDNLIHEIHLDDPTYTDAPIGVPGTDGDFKLDPDSPAGQVSFQTPRGLAFGLDGSLYVACADRHAVYALAPQSDGTVGPASAVSRVIGTGNGSSGAGRGHVLPGRTFDINEPMSLSTAPDGTLFVATPYGLATYDPVGEVASWYLIDAGLPKIFNVSFHVLEWIGFVGQSSTKALVTGDTYLFEADDSLLRSQLDPARTLDVTTTGATLHDPLADRLEQYQWVDSSEQSAVMIARTKTSGDPILTATYVPGTRRLATISDQSGGTFTFGYDGNNKLSSITDPASRVTHVDVDADGDLTFHPAAHRRNPHVQLRVPPPGRGDDASGAHVPLRLRHQRDPPDSRSPRRSCDAARRRLRGSDGVGRHRSVGEPR